MGLKVRNYLATANWRLILPCSGALAILGVALFWQLTTLLPGYSTAELQTYTASLSITALLDNPLNAPFLLLIKAMTYVFQDTLAVTRLVAGIGGLAVLGVFALLLKHWHDTSTAILGTMLFGLSAWFLHVARQGTPEVMLFGVFLLAASGFWLKRTNHWLPLALCFLLVAMLLYTPGALWFLVAGLVWQWKTIDRAFKKHVALVSVTSLLLVIALVPLGWALYKHPNLLLPLLGLPSSFPAPLQLAENMLKVPFHLVVHNAPNPATWLGTAPIFDVFSLTMLVLGGYVYLRHIRLARTRIFIILFIIMTILVALDGGMTFTVIMPFLYLVIAAGISQLLTQWFTVFPRNPIARTLGWLGISIVVLLACSYHLTHYFIGWPEAAATHEVFTIQKP